MKGLLLTYLLTYGGSLASLLNPYVGFLIYVAFAVLRPEALWHWSVKPGNYSRTIAVALLVGWCLHGLGRWNLGRAWLPTRLLLGFWIWLAVCTLTAIYPEVAWPRLESLSKIYLPWIVGISLISDYRQLVQLAWVIIGCQGYLALEFNRTYYEGFLHYDDWQFAGLDNNGIAIQMCTSVGMAFFMGLHTRSLLAKYAAYAAAALMSHVILFSMSRGGMVALGITGLVAFLLIERSPKHYIVLILGALLILRLAGPSVRAEFFSIQSALEGQTENARVTQWTRAFETMLQYPLVGIGPQNWMPFQREQHGWTMEVHSTWLQMGAETGVPGFFLLLGFYLFTSLRLLPYCYASKVVHSDYARSIARMVISSVVGFMVSAQFVTVEGVEIPYYAVLLGAGVLKLESQPQPGGLPLSPDAWLASRPPELPEYAPAPPPYELAWQAPPGQALRPWHPPHPHA